MVASEASKKAVWPRKFLSDLEVISDVENPIIKYCTIVGQWQSLRNQDAVKKKKTKHIEHKYHILRDFNERGDVAVHKIASEENLADPFTKALVARSFERYMEAMGL